MPHDANGTPLKVGDKVIIEGHIEEISEGADYCNCTVELLHRMPPEMTVTTISSINTRQLLSDEDADEDTDDNGNPRTAEYYDIGASPLGNGAFMAQPGVDDPRAEDGSCAPKPEPAPWWKTETPWFLLLLLVASYGLWCLIADTYSSRISTASPAEFSARFVKDEIDSWQRVLDARRHALKWAKSQGLVVDSVECNKYEQCDVVTRETTWGLRGCHRGECEINHYTRRTSWCHIGVDNVTVEVPCPK